LLLAKCNRRSFPMMQLLSSWMWILFYCTLHTFGIMPCYLVAADCSIFIVKTFVGQPNSISLNVLQMSLLEKIVGWCGWCNHSQHMLQDTSPFWSLLSLRCFNFKIHSFSAQAPPRR
jgi:hypothetical protein